MKKLIVMSLILFLGSCGEFPELSQKKDLDPILEDFKVKNYIIIDPNSGNTVVMAKKAIEVEGYDYMYQLDNGLWLVTNRQWRIGDQISLMSNIDLSKNYMDSLNKSYERDIEKVQGINNRKDKTSK